MFSFLRHWVLVGACCVPLAASACDVCGCASGSTSLGLLPLVPRHFVGMRWQMQGFRTDAHGSEPDAAEHFYAIDLWGRWQLRPRLQALGVLPYQFAQRNFQNGVQQSVRGWGDPSLLLQWNALQYTSPRLWQHTVQLGGGLKAPLGAHQQTDAEGQIYLPALQPGTGTTDFVANALYALRRGNWGGTAEGTARWTGFGPAEYRFGHRWGAQVRAFRQFATARGMVLPYVGAALDARLADRIAGKRQPDTGGRAWLGSVGVEYFANGFSISTGVQMSVKSQFAQGRVASLPRAQVSVAYFLGGRKKQAVLPLPQLLPIENTPSGKNH